MTQDSMPQTHTDIQLKAAAYKALAAAQGEFEAALKSANNPAFRSRYASLDACVDAVRPALNANGIFLMQRTVDTDAGVCVETVFMHESGYEISGGRLTVPVSKQDAQGFGSALTYARRYSLLAATGVAPENDDDGNAAAAAPAGPPKFSAPKLPVKPAAPAAPAAPVASAPTPPAPAEPSTPAPWEDEVKASSSTTSATTAGSTPNASHSDLKTSLIKLITEVKAAGNETLSEQVAATMSEFNKANGVTRAGDAPTEKLAALVADVQSMIQASKPESDAA